MAISAVIVIASITNDVEQRKLILYYKVKCRKFEGRKFEINFILACIKRLIQIESNQLEYFVYNENASKVIICFHGFGQKAEDYSWLTKSNSTYKVIAINLFFHGYSSLKPPRVLKANDWKNYFDELIQKESITRFSVMGYSMGGRFALTTLSLYANQVNHLYLIAPDGLVQGNWYLFATGTTIQRLLFKLVLNSYPLFLLIAQSLSKLGILNKGLLKFSQIHLQNKLERERVYNTWTSFRLLTLSTKKLYALSSKNKIKTLIVLGKYDRVIPIKRIEPKLIKSQYLTLKKVDITHHKLFYYNFLNPSEKSTSNSIE